LIIDIAPFANGTVPAAQSAAAAALGEYVKGCYGATPVAKLSSNETRGYNFTIKPPAMPLRGGGGGDSPGATTAVGSNVIDRVQIREDQSQGQFIRTFKLSAVVVANGGRSSSKQVVILCPTRASSIGNKYICMLPAPIQIASLTLEVTTAIGGTPGITQFAAFRCSDVAAAIDERWERTAVTAAR
jgi:hypothetical protein